MLRRSALVLALLLLLAIYGLSTCDQVGRVRLELISRIPTGDPALAVAVATSGQSIYVAGGHTVTEVVEVQPGYWGVAPDGTVELPAQPVAMQTEGSYVYVAGDGGVYLIDAEEHRIAASHVGHFRADGLQVTGDYLYAVLNWHEGDVQCGLYAFDGTSLAQVGALETPVVIDFVCTPSTFFTDVAVLPPYAYVVGDSTCEPLYAESFLGTVDVSEPSELETVGRYLPERPAVSVEVVDEYAYVAGSGLSVVDVSNPAEPRIVGRVGTATELTSIAVSLPFAYATDADGVVRAFYVSNPAKPALAASYDTGFPAHDIFVHEPYLGVANGDGGLLILHIVRDQ